MWLDKTLRCRISQIFLWWCKFIARGLWHIQCPLHSSVARSLCAKENMLNNFSRYEERETLLQWLLLRQAAHTVWLARTSIRDCTDAVVLTMHSTTKPGICLQIWVINIIVLLNSKHSIIAATMKKIYPIPQYQIQAPRGCWLCRCNSRAVSWRLSALYSELGWAF